MNNNTDNDIAIKCTVTYRVPWDTKESIHVATQHVVDNEAIVAVGISKIDKDPFVDTRNVHSDSIIVGMFRNGDSVVDSIVDSERIDCVESDACCKSIITIPALRGTLKPLWR